MNGSLVHTNQQLGQTDKVLVRLNQQLGQTTKALVRLKKLLCHESEVT